jgi:hypothetical protein
VVLYGCETWFLILREEHRLKVFENRVLRRIFGPKRDEMMKGGENCIMRSFMICALRYVKLEKQVDEMDGACSMNEEKRERI